MGYLTQAIRYGDPRNSWQRDSIPVDISLGERSRRIWTGGINPAAIRTDIQQSRLAEILAQPPKAGPRNASSRRSQCPSPTRLDGQRPTADLRMDPVADLIAATAPQARPSS